MTEKADRLPIMQFWSGFVTRIVMLGIDVGTCMTRNPKAEWTMVADAHPAIITEKQADQVYEKMQSRSRGQRIQMKPIYLLTGVLVCDLCEAAFQADKHGKKKITYYRCASRRRRGKFACDNKSHLEATAIEKQVLDQVMADLLEPAFFKQWMGEVNRKH